MTWPGVQVARNENDFWVLDILIGEQACLLEDIINNTRNLDWV